MNTLLFIEDLLSHRLLYPILIILVGFMAPATCGENIVHVEKIMNNFIINLGILTIIMITSLVDIPLAILWTITYLMIWAWIWDARNKREASLILQTTRK